MSEKNLQNSDDQEYWKFVETDGTRGARDTQVDGGDESDDESSSSVQESTESEKERDAA